MKRYISLVAYWFLFTANVSKSKKERWHSLFSVGWRNPNNYVPWQMYVLSNACRIYVSFGVASAHMCAFVRHLHILRTQRRSLSVMTIVRLRSVCRDSVWHDYLWYMYERVCVYMRVYVRCEYMHYFQLYYHKLCHADEWNLFCKIIKSRSWQVL